MWAAFRCWLPMSAVGGDFRGPSSLPADIWHWRSGPDLTPVLHPTVSCCWRTLSLLVWWKQAETKRPSTMSSQSTGHILAMVWGGSVGCFTAPAVSLLSSFYSWSGRLSKRSNVLSQYAGRGKQNSTPTSLQAFPTLWAHPLKGTKHLTTDTTLHSS